ncbi:MAG: hypothetical protein JG777_886 [Clostridia bacterium]|nr:hypothetical protein [Clostridia bacterium]
MNDIQAANIIKSISVNSKIYTNCLILFLLLIGAFYISSLNYLLFHTAIELFAIIIAFNITIIAINTYPISKNDYFMFLGIAFGFVGIFNLCHVFTYEGINIFSRSNTNISLQFWIAAGCIKGLSILFSFIFFHRTVKPYFIFFFYAFVSLFLLLAIYYWGIFPDCFIDGKGLTAFKIISEYVISLILLISITLLIQNKKHVRSNIFWLMLLFFITAIASKLSFTLFLNPRDLLHTIGHLFKLISFYLIYKAINETSLKDPYWLLFNQLSKTNNENSKLEIANRQLSEENINHKNFQEKITHLNRLYSVLSEINKAIVHIHDTKELYKEACRIAVEKGQFRMAWIGLINSNASLVEPVAYWGFEEEYLTAIKISTKDISTGCGPVGLVIHENKYFVANDIENQFHAYPWYAEAIKRNYYSIAAFPIQVQGNVVGTMCFYSEKRNFFNEEEINLLQALVDDLSFAIESIENERQHELIKETLKETLDLDKLKTEFFANISHELKTPINVIFSTLQLLTLYSKSSVSKNNEDKMDKYIHVMKQNCYRLIRLVNNVVDVTKIDSGFFNLSLQNHNIINLVEEITLSVAQYIEGRGLLLEFDTTIEEKVIACDPDKIERIILNLLSNAIKFTNPGGKISVNIDDKGESITISVKDTGIGIPEDKLNMIFERFRQVDKSLARNHEGSGIGLSLVKSLVEMHGGKISVKSEYGKGSEFIIELPVRILPQQDHTSEHNMNNIKQGAIEKINIEFSDIYV